MQKFISKSLGYFFTGMVIVLPPVITTYFLYYLYEWISSLGGFVSAGILVFFILVILIFVGYMASTFIGDNFLVHVERWIIKTPLLGFVYKSTKDVTKALVGSENKFSEPVMVEHLEGIFKLGFITNRDMTLLIGEDVEYQDDTLVAVYFPMTFSVSGDMFLVAQSKIHVVNRKANTVMQTIVSGGLVNA